jgi:heme oxygenase
MIKIFNEGVIKENHGEYQSTQRNYNQNTEEGLKNSINFLKKQLANCSDPQKKATLEAMLKENTEKLQKMQRSQSVMPKTNLER